MYYEYLRVGKIVNTQGVKGEVRVIPLTDDIERFIDLEYVNLDNPNHDIMYIEHVKYHKNFVLIKFKGINDMDSANKLRDSYLVVDRKHAVKLPEGSYFVCDIIDTKVYDLNGTLLGKIADVISTGSNDVYVVKDEKKEMLIPALKTVVKEMDIQNGRIVVDLPEGLMDNED